MPIVSHPARAAVLRSRIASGRVPIFLIGDSTDSGTSGQMGWFGGVSLATSSRYPMYGMMVGSGLLSSAYIFHGARQAGGTPAASSTLAPAFVDNAIPANTNFAPHRYAYFDDAASITANQANKWGLRMNATHPARGPSNVMRMAFSYSTFASGAGTIRPIIFGNPSQVSSTGSSVAAIVTAPVLDEAYLFGQLTQVFASADGENVDMMFAGRAGGQAFTAEGPIAWLYQTIDNPAKTAGVSVSPFAAVGGATTRDILVNIILSFPSAIQTYLRFMRDSLYMDADGFCVCNIRTGTNDRGDTTQSVQHGGSSAPNNTGEGYTNNVSVIIEQLRAAHAANGFDPLSMWFILTPPTSFDPSSTLGGNVAMAEFRAAAQSLGDTVPNVIGIDLDQAVSPSQVTANGWRLNINDVHHARAGYEGFAALEWDAIDAAIAGGGGGERGRRRSDWTRGVLRND